MDTPTSVNPGLGHNRPSAHAALSDQVDQLASIANEWLDLVPEIETEEQAEKASDFAARVKALAKDVEEARKAEKKPHDDAAKAVQERYKPLGSKLKVISDLFGPKLTDWLRKKEAERREAERKAEEEALRKMEEAEAAQKAADHAAGGTVEATMEAEAAQKAADQAVADAHRISKSTVGAKGKYSNRKTALRTTYSAEITDYAAALDHCMNDPRVKDAVQQVANAWARSPEARNTPFPGVKLNETQRAA